MEKARVRFAPSPTGHLHVGNVHTALFAWLFARGNGGMFVLRIEDTDRERSTSGFEKEILEDMTWLGLDWDEGPDKGGAYGPYRQSQRLNLYRDAVQRLLDQGDAYPCYCDPGELEEERAKALAGGRPPRYSGRCRHLTEADRAAYEAQGRRPVIRFRLPEGGRVDFTDLIRGDISFPVEGLDDFVLVRADGTPLYNLAATVDDALMGITHVLRGEEHLSNTPRQILLYQALGYQVPHFGHLGILLGPDGTKLSKRHGAPSLREMREEGFLPQAVVWYLAALGFTPPAGTVSDAAALARVFDLGKVSSAPAVFDGQRLRQVNGEMIRALEPEAFLAAAQGYLGGGAGKETIPRLAAVQDEITTLADLPAALSVFDPLPGERLAEIVAGEEEELRALARYWSTVRSALTGQDFSRAEGLKDLVKALPKELGLKGRAFFHPVRLLLTGREQGPELYRIMLALGKDETIRRLEQGLSLLHP